MKHLLFVLLLLSAPFPSYSEQNAGSLANFMATHGYAGAKVERRLGNHMFVPCDINKHHAALMIDTGAPITVIDKNSVGTFGLKVEQTKTNVGGAFGTSWERFGVSKVQSIAMGNCTITSVPVGLVEMSSMNDDFLTIHVQHLNGLLGLREMRKFGMVIDCARQMLYVNPNGSSAGASQSLASFLAGRGFTRIPLRTQSSGHIDLEGAINGHPTRFILDTGAPNTCIDQAIAIKAGLSYQPMPHFRTGGAEGSSQAMNNADVKELTVGGFTIPKANIEVVRLSPEVLKAKSASESNAGFFGAEYLAFNFGVIDVGGGALYLRHADSK